MTIGGKANENDRRGGTESDTDTDTNCDTDTEAEDWAAPGSLPRGVQWNLQKRLESHLRDSKNSNEKLANAQVKTGRKTRRGASCKSRGYCSRESRVRRSLVKRSSLRCFSTPVQQVKMNSAGPLPCGHCRADGLILGACVGVKSITPGSPAELAGPGSSPTVTSPWG